MKRKAVESSVWKSFIRLIKRIKLPYLLLSAAFFLNLGKAVIELIVPERIAALTAFDLTTGDRLLVDTAFRVCMIIFILALVSFTVGLAAAYITYIAKARISRDFQTVASRKVFFLKLKDIEARDPKEFISRITTDTGFVSDFLIDLLVNEIPRLYFIVSTIVKTARMGDPVLVISFLLVIPVVILGSLFSGSVAYRTQNTLQEAVAKLTAKLAEKVNNIEIIKAYNRSEEEIAKGEGSIEELKTAQKKTTMAVALYELVSNILFVVPIVMIMLAGASELLKGAVTRQQFIEFYGLGTTYQIYIAAHLTLWVYLKRAQGATRRLSEIMSMEEERSGNRIPDNTGDIVFDHVSFSYGEEEILSDLSFTVKAGSRFAIVGPSGSGKSTICNLIEQFYRPEKGTITLNGTDIREYEIRSYRDLFAYLPQNAPGFSGTVRDMLTYSAKKTYTDEELKAMLSKVGIDENILPDGLDHEVGTNASKLSGGQRQRLAIARMLLKGSQIVLMDEATSALDIEGKEQIASLIDEYAKDKTCILVTHDLKRAADADTILVLDHGKAVGCGTHNDLLKSCPLYRDLFHTGKEETE